MLVPGEARSRFSDARTDEERLRAYDNFIADAGTYEIDGSRLSVRNIIAKVPNAMPQTPGERRPGRGIVYRYRFEGDSLVLTFDRGWAPPDGEITYRLDRLE